jgi:hypothetical protein
MYSVVERWVQSLPDRGSSLNQELGSESVKAGKNHTAVGGSGGGGHSHGGFSFANSIPGFGSHSKVSDSPFAMFTKKRELGFEDEGSGEPSGGAYEGQQGEYQQQSQGRYYGQQQQQGYGQPSYPPQGATPENDYTYTMPTNYAAGYNDGYQQQPQGQYGQGQYPPQQQYPPQNQRPYGGQYR